MSFHEVESSLPASEKTTTLAPAACRRGRVVGYVEEGEHGIKIDVRPRQIHHQLGQRQVDKKKTPTTTGSRRLRLVYATTSASPTVLRDLTNTMGFKASMLQSSNQVAVAGGAEWKWK
jgi:hypothetical protein